MFRQAAERSPAEGTIFSPFLFTGAINSVSKFKREFDVASVEKALLAPENAWFKDLLRHWRPAGDLQGVTSAQGVPANHLRLAIRDGYLNFYRAGQSVAKVKFVKNKLQWEIHNKYVYGPDKGKNQDYVKITGGRFRNQDGADLEYRGDLLHDWILNANGYADREKLFVDDLVAHQAGAIDLEAGLPADPELWTEKSAPRMDLVTVEPCGDHYRLAFWEVKLVDNKEARCKDANEAPKVIIQLKKYEKWLAKNRKLVCDAYRRCCSDLVKLHEIAKAVNPGLPELGEAIIAVGQKSAPLCLDGTPRLIIDATKGEGKFRQNDHLKKLNDLGICVRMVRTSADLVMSAHA